VLVSLALVGRLPLRVLVSLAYHAVCCDENRGKSLPVRNSFTLAEVASYPLVSVSERTRGEMIHGTFFDTRLGGTLGTMSLPKPSGQQFPQFPKPCLMFGKALVTKMPPHPTMQHLKMLVIFLHVEDL
jgi:hypothetical protein